MTVSVASSSGLHLTRSLESLQNIRRDPAYWWICCSPYCIHVCFLALCSFWCCGVWCHLHALSHSRCYLVHAWSVAVQQSLLDHGAVIQISPSQYECDDINMSHLATVPVSQSSETMECYWSIGPFWQFIRSYIPVAPQSLNTRLCCLLFDV